MSGADDTLALIDADIATLTRLVVAPDGNVLGYGTDLSCVSDCTDDFAEVDPNSPLGIAEALIRRLTCPRGGLPDDANYGVYLPGYVNRGVTLQELRELNGVITNECRKDDRVADVVATTTYVATKIAPTLSVAIQVTPEEPSLGVFTFTISVADDKVLLETIS
jgi:hypothetical protein